MRLLLLKSLLLLELLLKNHLLLHGGINLLRNTWIILTCLVWCCCRNLLKILILLLLLHHLLLLLRCHVLHLLFSFLLLHLLLSHLGLLCRLSSHLLLLLILAFFLSWLNCVFFIVCTLLGASRFWIFLLAFFHSIRLSKCLWGLDLNLLRGWLLLRNIDSNSYFGVNKLILSFNFFLAFFLVPARFLSILSSTVLNINLRLTISPHIFISISINSNES